mmetsp:Transcript_12666/g.16534  ORF Transcript_12666/g.16534 Transcript_12666/m.16534 type:complete len:224 (+) Transcript_12666:133-804(+)
MNRSFILLIAFLSLSQFFRGGDAFVQRALIKHTDWLWQLQATTSSSSSIATAEDIIKFAEKGGVKLSINTLGPAYRAVARASHNETLVIGYCEGFVRPTGNILHLDKMEVFKKSLIKCREENPDEFTGGGTVFGVGLLLGCLCLTHGLENGCTMAEFLAIDDENFQHKRLVRHYKRLGLNVVRYVGDDLKSIPDRLIWGGCGTLMEEKIQTLMEKWTPTFKIG